MQVRVYFCPHACAPEEVGDVGEGRKAGSIKENIQWVQVTTARLSMLSATHSTLSAHPIFVRTGSLHETSVCLQTRMFLTHAPYADLLRLPPVFFVCLFVWGLGASLHFKIFFKLT